MGFFNKKRLEAMNGRGYFCSQCGTKMFFENEFEDTLICPNCGHEIPTERYGMEDDEDYDALYPTAEEVLGVNEDEDDDNEFGETYEEEFNELSHDD